jgi:hypothetical protein
MSGRGRTAGIAHKAGRRQLIVKVVFKEFITKKGIEEARVACPCSLYLPWLTY